MACNTMCMIKYPINMYASICRCQLRYNSLFSKRRTMLSMFTLLKRTPSHIIQTDSSSTSEQKLAVIKRLVQMKPSQRNHKLLGSHRWDKISADLTQVYESSMKTFLWGFYVSQGILAVVTCCFLYDLPRITAVLPEGYDHAIFAALCFSWSSLLFFSFWSRRVIIAIYHNQQSGQFTAVRRTCLGRLKKFDYIPADVVPIGHPKEDADLVMQVKVKGQLFYLKSNDFVLPKYYNMHFPHQDMSGDIKESYVRGPKF